MSVNVDCLHWLKVTPENVSAVAALDRQCFEFPWSEADFQGSLQAGHEFLALACDEEIVGFAVYMLVFDQAELLTIGVSPRYRRQGMAALLMQQMFAQLVAAGASELFLEVRESNIPAQALYTRHGFEPLARRKGYYPTRDGREDAIVMKKVF